MSSRSWYPFRVRHGKPLCHRTNGTPAIMLVRRSSRIETEPANLRCGHVSPTGLIERAQMLEIAQRPPPRVESHVYVFLGNMLSDAERNMRQLSHVGSECGYGPRFEPRNGTVGMLAYFLTCSLEELNSLP